MITCLLLILIFVIENSVSRKNVSTYETQNPINQSTKNLADSNKDDDIKIPVVQNTKVDKEIADIKQEIVESGGKISTNDKSLSSVDVEDKFDPVKEYSSLLEMSPMVIFSKSYCPHCTKLKELLSQEYEFSPNYMVIELDKHKNGAELQKYIGTKTGIVTVPNVIINGISRGGSDSLRSSHSKGELLDNLKLWGGKSLTVSQIKKPSNN